MTLVAINSLRLHPDAERVPLADRGDLAALRDSLREHGQQDPIDVTSGGVILDGRTRWTLLRELGALDIAIRTVDLPPAQQTHYIVDRALARRHLTAEQKRALNGLLREAVFEEIQHPKTGEIVRVGKGQSQRAETLGVERETVRRWDRADDAPATNVAGASEPTHFRRSNGHLLPVRPNREPQAEPPAQPIRSAAARPAAKPRRAGPSWHRHFTLWCRGVLPEDRPYLLAMSVELHKALGLLELSCEGN